jgi:hypothetical protein
MPLPAVAESAIDRVLEKLDGVKPAGHERWMALCPSHDDRQRSLSLTIGTDRRVLMKCHAGCDSRAVVAALGLTMAELFVGAAKPASPVAEKAQGVETRARLVATYDYSNLDGSLAFQSCRFEPKKFSQRRRNGAGEWTWNLNGVTTVLYRLPEVAEAVALGKRVFVVEGEKDADALAGYGYPATTNPMGAGKWREHYSKTLAGSEVVILPDNDDAGRSHAEQVAASLTAANCHVKIVGLPNLPPKGDVSDWLEAGGDFDSLEELIGATRFWVPDPSKRTRWRLDEIWQDAEMMRPPAPVVPYLAWASRSTLLAAREKSGKSTLTGFVAAQVSNGGDFLGEPCTLGTVLIVGLEEFIGDTARRLKDFGAEPERVYLVDRFLGEPEDRLAEIRQHIEAVRSSLVIVDSLVAYSAGLVESANNATQTQNVVQGLTDLSHTTAVALIVIHHARKADGKYRDSSAIGGAVDIIAEVYPPDEFATTDPSRRRVRPVGRVPARGVDFRYDGHEYTLVDPSGPQKAPIDQRIQAIVRDRPGCSANDVAEAVGEQRQQTLTRITHMIASGLLVNDGNSRLARLRLPSFAPAAAFL